MQSPKNTPTLTTPFYLKATTPLFLLSQLSYSLGSFIADYNHTHIHNPRWPPHARFHNGQTMSLGVVLAATSTYYWTRPKRTSDMYMHDIMAAALVGSMYCVAGLTAIWYPGSDWVDPEFMGDGPRRPQLWMFSAIVGVAWACWAGEKRKVGKAKVL
jgi:hypothetical protein